MMQMNCLRSLKGDWFLGAFRSRYAPSIWRNGNNAVQSSVRGKEPSVTGIKSMSLTVLAVVFYAFTSKGQDLTPVIPPLPEAAAIANFSLSTMNYSNGTPNINIPIHTMAVKALSVPIALTYNPSGIKVEEEASMAGLGWTLQYGGLISRTVKGLPDDIDEKGYIHTTKTVQWMHSNWTQIESNAANQEALEGYNDFEPDDFTVSIPGYSTTLFYDQQSDSFIQRPFVGLLIEPEFVNSRINKWIITAPNGVRYYFGISKDLSRT